MAGQRGGDALETVPLAEQGGQQNEHHVRVALRDATRRRQRLLRHRLCRSKYTVRTRHQVLLPAYVENVLWIPKSLSPPPECIAGAVKYSDCYFCDNMRFEGVAQKGVDNCQQLGFSQTPLLVCH